MALLLIAAAFVGAALSYPEAVPELREAQQAHEHRAKVIGITGAVLVGAGLALHVFYSRRR
jgi:hypothetical protein